MLVARGSADVMLEPELATWDWAALWVIVEEAGGRVSTFEGKPPVARLVGADDQRHPPRRDRGSPDARRGLSEG